MKLRYLLDSNIISEPVRLRPNVGVVTRLERNQGKVAIPSVALHELMYGLYRLPVDSKKRQSVALYFEGLERAEIPVLSYDAEAASWHAEERAYLESIGRVIPFVDFQIAAIAEVRGLVLVTGNLKDFQGIRDLEVENWFS